MQFLTSQGCASKFQPLTGLSVPSSADPQGTEEPQFKPKKILVVDDEKDLADLTIALLDHYGIDGVVAYSAADALLLLESDSEIAVVFSDIRMPGMSGLELAEVMRQRFPHVRVLLTSGYTHPNLLAGYDRADEIVAKPWDIADIVRRLRD